MKWRAAFRPKSYRDMRVGCQLGWLQLESKKEPGSRGPPGTVWEETPNVGLRTATRQAMVAQCSPSPTKAEGPAARRRISMRRKSTDQVQRLKRGRTDIKRLKDVANRAMNQRGKADVCEGP